MKALKLRQVCLFFIAFLPVTKFFMLPSILALNSGEDLWLSSLLSIGLDLLTVVILTIVCVKSKMTFYNLLEFNFGKIGSKIILSFYLVYFLIKSIIPINEQETFIENTLYENIPTILSFMPFFVFAFYLCQKQLRILGRLADVMWIFTSLGFVFLCAISISNVDFASILPIGARGFNNILRASYKSHIWQGDCVYLMFFIGNFTVNKNKAWKIPLCHFIASLLVVLFMIMFYGIFTSIAHRQTFSLTEIAKYSSVINAIGRFDYIGIMLILMSTAISISLPLFFATDICAYLFNAKKRWIFALIICILIFCILKFLGEYFYTIQNLLLTYGNAFFIVFSNILPMLTIFLKKEKNLDKTF